MLFIFIPDSIAYFLYQAKRN